MFKSSRLNDRNPEQKNNTHDITLPGTQLAIEQLDNNNWQAINFPGTISIDQLSGSTPHSQTNAMDSSSNHPSNSTPSSIEQSPITESYTQREAELLSLVRDLNECNDVLLAKVSQLEESLDHSQVALQSEVDRTDASVGDREFAQLVTELEQSRQALHHHQVLSETLQTELSASRKRGIQLETEHANLLRQNTEQSQELLQANANCRDLRARLQRQQRYTLQFKAALEKCLSMASGPQNTTGMTADAPTIAMPKTDKIRPWESAPGNDRLDPQLESMIRGIQSQTQGPANPLGSEAIGLDREAENVLWHDLARVMEPTAATADSEPKDMADHKDMTEGDNNFVPQFTEPSPWTQKAEAIPTEVSSDNNGSDLNSTLQLSPQASEIVARIQSARIMTEADTYLPAVSAQSNPSPLVHPLKPQRRISSLSAIDLPSFPRLKKQPPKAQSEAKV